MRFLICCVIVFLYDNIFETFISKFLKYWRISWWCYINRLAHQHGRFWTQHECLFPISSCHLILWKRKYWRILVILAIAQIKEKFRCHCRPLFFILGYNKNTFWELKMFCFQTYCNSLDNEIIIFRIYYFTF